MLVAHGAWVNVALPHGFLPNMVGMTPLMTAVDNDDEQSALYLMDHGADVNARSTTGYTPLMYAQLGNVDHPVLTRALIAHGARIADKARDGSDALSLAQEKGNTE